MIMAKEYLVAASYYDQAGKLPEMNCLLGGERMPKRECYASIRWQMGNVRESSDARSCLVQPGEWCDRRTVWHVVEPLPDAYMVRCTDCGRTFRVERGGYTREAFHRIASDLWGSAVDCQESVFFLSEARRHA